MVKGIFVSKSSLPKLLDDELQIINYVIQNPYVDLRQIRENTNVVKNWNSIKKLAAKLVKAELLDVVNYFSEQKYFVYPHVDDPVDLARCVYLKIKDVALSHIDSDEELRHCQAYQNFVLFHKVKNLAKMPKKAFERGLMEYSFGITLNRTAKDQILEKILNLYYLKTKILLAEYERVKLTEDYDAINRWREMAESDMTRFFMFTFMPALQNFPKTYFEPSIWRKSLELIQELDHMYENLLDFYNRLSSGGRTLTDLLDLQYIALYETKKDASEKYHIKMKQTGNLLERLRNNEGEIDHAKIQDMIQVEGRLNGMNTVKGYAENMLLLESLLEQLENSKGKMRKRTKEMLEGFFPEISLA